MRVLEFHQYHAERPRTYPRPNHKRVPGLQRYYADHQNRTHPRPNHNLLPLWNHRPTSQRQLTLARRRTRSYQLPQKENTQSCPC